MVTKHTNIFLSLAYLASRVAIHGKGLTYKDLFGSMNIVNCIGKQNAQFICQK